MENTADRIAIFMAEGFYIDFDRYMRGKRIYVSRTLARNLGKNEWNNLLKEFVGYFTVSQRNGIAIDSLYEEMIIIFPYLFSGETINQVDQILVTFENLRKARTYKKEISNANSISNQFKRRNRKNNNSR